MTPELPEPAAEPRDRDAAGRARNARPRDALGRPLPRGAAGDERLPDDLVLPPAQALRLAQQLLDEGRPFHAHEVLEASWKTAPAAERDLWQGLAQIAVGLTHALRGNAPGAAALLRRGADRVDGYAGPAPHGIDAAGVCQAAREMASSGRALPRPGPTRLPCAWSPPDGPARTARPGQPGRGQPRVETRAVALPPRRTSGLTTLAVSAKPVSRALVEAAKITP